MKQQTKKIWGIFLVLFILITILTVITTVSISDQYLLSVLWISGSVLFALCIFMGVRKLVVRKYTALFILAYYILSVFLSLLVGMYFADFLLYDVWELIVVEKTEVSPIPFYLLSELQSETLIVFISLVTCFFAIGDYEAYGKNKVTLFFIYASIILFIIGYILII
jgi:hypothetical protein